MGNCNFKNEKEEKENLDSFSVCKNHFTLHFIIGRGGFGKVNKI